MTPKILLIYTGGTIGMIKDALSGALKSFNFNELLIHIPEIRQLDCEITTISYEQPIDSSDMGIQHWKSLGNIINNQYQDYDAFVVLHGSDTMSYTSSMLSFMFENLTKPIIFTGSQLPIGDLRTDAKENLITSLQLASICEQEQPLIQEVCIYFEYQLYRANRTLKLNAEHFEAFSSPNYPPLAISGVHLNVKRRLLRRNPVVNDMVYKPEMCADVVILKIFPGITRSVVERVCTTPGLKGIILETYGAGNAPTLSWFTAILTSALENGIQIINVSQCHGGSVDMGKYDTSVQLKAMGIISGHDMTTEAALAKLMHLLVYTDDATTFKEHYNRALRGELTVINN